MTKTDDAGGKTVRRRMIELLGRSPMSAKDLSKELGIREKAVIEHLPHAAKSAAAEKKRLTVLPFSCLSCGFEFVQRARFTRPGRCPKCKGTRIETPVFEVR